MSYTLTTPLYYVNDRAHLGSAYTTLACDTIARFQRLKNHFGVLVNGQHDHLDVGKLLPQPRGAYDA